MKARYVLKALGAMAALLLATGATAAQRPNR